MRPLAAASIFWAPLVLAIWPLPSQYTSGTTVLWMSPNTSVTYDQPLHHQFEYALYAAASAPPSSVLSNRIVQTAVKRAYNTIFKENFVPWRFYPRNSDFQPTTDNKVYISSITLKQNEMDPKNLAKPTAGEINEGYTLEMTESGKVTITSPSSIGIARALTTLTQLFFAHSNGGAYTKLAPVSISDAPKFAHRGLNMDVARSWYPVADILRTIDALSYNKFNRLHLHATDAQSWPLQIPALPALSGKGAYQADLSYSPTELLNIQEYGSVRGLEVIIEIDMPGHTTSIGYGYPNLIAAFNEQPDWDQYASEPPSGTLKLNSSDVYSFLDTLWKDLLPRVSPYTSYFHTGGDEVNFNAYKLDPTVRSSDPAVLRPLLQKFVDHNHAKIRAAGLTPLVWEEVLLDYNITLGSDVIVQTWISDSSVAEVVKTGHRALAGNYNFWYLDCGQGQWLDFEIGSASQEYWPYADYCSPRKNWRLMYSYDPLEGVPANLQHLVVGGEASIWSEQTDPINLDRMVWPRAAAAGEILWSGAKDASGQNRSQIAASPRLAEMRERLVARGVMAEPVQMPFCTQDGENCALYNS